ncbi:Toll/interleukin-1 receptor domain-containing protein, partial [Tanacetum coccineum]
HEAAVIQTVVDTISDNLLSPKSNIDEVEEFVGMTDRVKDLISRLEIGTGGVRMVGIWGVGVGGKTTLATSVYMKIKDRFQGYCIIDNIREESSKHSLKTLQEKLLKVVLKTKVEVESEEQGKRMIRERLSDSNVLILLDDADDRNQLEALAGSHKWFGDGSRIIITTRDEHVLRTRKVDHISSVTLLSQDERSQIFKKHTYNEEEPLKDYGKLSLRVVSYAGGLPLALKVLGIRVLIQKALITIDLCGKFDMHDLVQEMGHYIVRGYHPKNPEKHSRVWKREEINNMYFGDTTSLRYIYWLYYPASPFPEIFQFKNRVVFKNLVVLKLYEYATRTLEGLQGLLVASQVIGEYTSSEEPMKLLPYFTSFFITMIPIGMKKRVDALSKLIALEFEHMGKKSL